MLTIRIDLSTLYEELTRVMKMKTLLNKVSNNLTFDQAKSGVDALYSLLNLVTDLQTYGCKI